MFAKKQKIHFIGIGGIGMSGIARILLSLGYKVSGSDLNDSETTRRLKEMGAQIFTGHNESNLSEDVSAIVTSTAIPANNPELLEARNRKIVVVHRGEMLAELMRMRYGVAVSGTHGKTTTTSIVSHILTEAGLSPTSVIGGKHFNIDSNANLGEGDLLICEADESDGSFLKLTPVVTVITNIDNDHLDYYKTEQALKSAFLEFANSVPFYGATFICFENPQLVEISEDIHRRFFSYGFSIEHDLCAMDLEESSSGVAFKVLFQGEELGKFKSPLLGRHNVLNSLAAIGSALFLDVNTEDIKKGLESFKGVGRRLNLIKDSAIKVYDDYGHHPTEIKATLKALRAVVKNRLIVVFQPHRYSRTEQLFTEFGASFNDADVLVVTDIYAASEQPRAGISGETVYQEVIKNKPEDVYYVKDKSDVPAFLKAMAKDGDTVLTLGAGDIYKSGADFAETLQ